MNILKTLTILSCILLISSCAMMSNNAYQTVKFASNKPIRALIIQQDTFFPDDKTYNIDIYREKYTKQATVFFDSTALDFDLKSHLSPYYVFGNLASPDLLGYLIDLASNKRFAYQSSFYFDVKKREVFLYKWKPPIKNDRKWVVSMPNINAMRIKVDNKDSTYFAGLGFSVGFERFYQANQYISAGIGVASDHFFPIDDGHRRGGTDEGASMIYAYFRNNVNIYDLEIGYGFQASRYQWYKIGDFETRRENNFGIGLSLSTQYRISQYGTLGILYQPSLIKLNQYKQGVDYQHLISTELIFKF